MKQQILTHLTLGQGKIPVPLPPVEGQVSAHITLIDYQSQTAQARAQIVRKNKCAAITLSAYYTSHAKQKKVNVPTPGYRHYSHYTTFIPFIPFLYPFIPYNKIHNISPQRVSTIHNFTYTPDPEFENYSPHPRQQHDFHIATVYTQTFLPYINSKL